MEIIIYIGIGLILGGIIGYTISKLSLYKKYDAEVLRLTKESGEKISKQEVEQNFIAKSSYELVNARLQVTESNLKDREVIISNLYIELTKLQQEEINLNNKLTTFKSELENLHALSQLQFKNLATDILEEKKAIFVAENKKELNTILEPLTKDLIQFREKVEATRKEDIKDLTTLKSEILSLQNLNLQLSDDAKNLATALKSDVKMQGNWGEDRLNMILEAEGLQRYVDYNREKIFQDGETETGLKPDFIINLPEGKKIIIDSKVSLTAYVNYFNAPTQEEKEKHLALHLKSVIDHIKELSGKKYQKLVGLNSPDYVFMFMPVESSLTLALNHNTEILIEAAKKKIVLVTPSTLIASLKIVKLLWQKENQIKNVEKIFEIFGGLYDKFATFISEMDKVEIGLKNAYTSYLSAMYQLKDGKRKSATLIGKFEAIKELEASVTKQIPKRHLDDIELLCTDETEIKMLENAEEILEQVKIDLQQDMSALEVTEDANKNNCKNDETE